MTSCTWAATLLPRTTTCSKRMVLLMSWIVLQTTALTTTLTRDSSTCRCTWKTTWEKTSKAASMMWSSSWRKPRKKVEEFMCTACRVFRDQRRCVCATWFTPRKWHLKMASSWSETKDKLPTPTWPSWRSSSGSTSDCLGLQLIPSQSTPECS